MDLPDSQNSAATTNATIMEELKTSNKKHSSKHQLIGRASVSKRSSDLQTRKGLSIDDSVASVGEKTPVLPMSKLSSFQKAKGSSIIGNFPKTQARSRKKRMDKGQRHESLENVPEVSEEDLSFEFNDYVIKLKDNKDSISKVP